jgi:hypothetical protein
MFRIVWVLNLIREKATNHVWEVSRRIFRRRCSEILTPFLCKSRRKTKGEKLIQAARDCLRVLERRIVLLELLICFITALTGARRSP